MKFQEILTGLGLRNVRRNGDRYTALCPAHEDKKNSLSLSDLGDKTVLYCHAGCTIVAVCEALGIGLKDLFAGGESAGNNSALQTSKDRRQIAAVYPYTDEKGILLYENVRFEPKDFRQRRPNGKRGFDWHLNGARRVPYRLPELIAGVQAGADVLLGEGEKDADNLRSLGFTASSFKNWKIEFNGFIRNAHVSLLIDHDRSGVRQAEDAVQVISGNCASLRIVDLFEGAELPDKLGLDVSDWIVTRKEAGQSGLEIAQDLAAIVENAPEWSSGRNATPIQIVNGKLAPLKAIRLSELQSALVEWLWEPYLAFGTFTILEGEEGLGKTYIALALLAAVASGRGLPGVPQSNHIAASNVLILSAEDSLTFVIKPRLESMGANTVRIIAIEEPFTLDKDGILRLSMVMEKYQPKLVVIDPLFSYTGRIDHNKDNEIRFITDALKRLAEKYGCVILGIRHIGKSKGFGDPRNAGLNGIGWRASARSVLLVGKNPDDEQQKALCQTKNNLALKPEKSIGFEIVDGRFYWTGESDLTAETMLSSVRPETTEERSDKHEAMAFLRETLGPGRMRVKDLKDAAKAAGVSDATLRRAKAVLKVKSVKEKLFDGDWYWELSNVKGDCEDALEGVPINAVERLRANY